MNIYIIPAWYPENQNDLNASFIREQAQSLSKRGHRIKVIVLKVFSIREIKPYIRYKRHIWDDMSIETIYTKKLVFIPSRFVKWHHNAVSSKYYRVIRANYIKDIKKGNQKPDLIHSHVGPWCSYFVIPAAKKIGLPIVTTEHYSGLSYGILKDIKFTREKYVIENSDLTIFVGSSLRKKVLEVTNAKGATTIIPNQINPDFFPNNKSKERKDKFIFLTACNLIPRKKVEDVVNAFHNEFSNNDKVEYLIAGDGPERERLERLVNELGENNRICFFGKYSREEMPSLFSSCDSFALVSEFEPFGIVYIEAMMCGLPCIGTKGQGSDDIINKRNGITVDYGNIRQLRKAMRLLFENINSYNPQLIINETTKKFSNNTICSKIEAEYKKILQRQ